MPPRRSWRGLSFKEQRQVLRAARRREGHPDAEIADAAYRWAQEGSQGNSDGAGSSASCCRSLMKAAGGGWLGIVIAERRTAKGILRARAAREE